MQNLDLVERPDYASARLGALKSRGVPEGDPRVVACRQALAYRKIHKVIDAEAGRLSLAGADRLVAELRQAAAQ